MPKEGIGFMHGMPENPDRTWERSIHGTMFVFSKTRDKNGFLYKCACGTANRSWLGSSDLSPEDIEKAPQFSAFISSYKPRP